MTAIIELDQAELTAFSQSAAAIAEMRERYMPLTINGIEDKDGFKAVHEARMVVKKKRVEVENRRKELKADALEYGRKVDSAAKQLTALLTPIEEHLEAEETAVTQERERIKREAEEAKARKLQQRVQKMVAVEAPIGAAMIALMTDEEFSKSLATFTEAFNTRKAEAARVAAEEAEAKRQEAIRVAKEREELEAERKRLAEVERQQKAEADRIAAEHRKIAEAKAAEEKRIADEAAAKARAEELERERQAAAERARIETEARVKREAEELARQKAEAEEARRREEAMRPDREKLLSYVDQLAAVIVPHVSTDSEELRNEVQIIVQQALTRVRKLLK